MRAHPSEKSLVTSPGTLDVEKTFESPLSFRTPRPQVNKRLDLVTGLLYTLPQSLSVDVLQIPYRNWLSVPRKRRLVNLFLGRPVGAGSWGP